MVDLVVKHDILVIPAVDHVVAVSPRGSPSSPGHESLRRGGSRVGDRLSPRRVKGNRDVPSRLVDGDVPDKPRFLTSFGEIKESVPFSGADGWGFGRPDVGKLGYRLP
jgi:hypothetical protein